MPDGSSASYGSGDQLPYPGDDPDALTAVAARISDGRTWIARANDALFDIRTQLTGAWEGLAATAGDAEVGRIIAATEAATGRLDTARSAVFRCAATLEQSRSRIDGIRSNWQTAEAQCRRTAEELATTVAADRRIVLEADHRRFDAMRQAALVDYTGQIGVADSAAQTCRDALAATLSDGVWHSTGAGMASGGLAAALGLDLLVSDDAFRSRISGTPAQWVALSEAGRQLMLASAGTFPPPGATEPRAVAGAWSALRPLQQEALLQTYPALIGAIDGLPAAVRDRANRRALPAVRAALQAQRDELVNSLDGATNPVRALVLQAAVDQADNMLSGIDTLAAMLDESGAPAPSVAKFLLALDVLGGGHAVVAVGDPDLSDRVGVFIPGKGSYLGNFPDNIRRGEVLRDATMQAGAVSPAVVVWLGYTAPPTLAAAARDEFADSGIAALHGFLAGIRASSAAHPPAIVTAVVHSYAALLAARAASIVGLPIDQLAIVGGAGTELSSVTDMHFDGVSPERMSDRVLVVTNKNDPILATRLVHGGMAQDPDFGAHPVTVTGPEPTWGDYLIRSGLQLSSPLAAAIPVYDVDAHTEYFNPGDGALGLIGAFIARTPPR